MAKKILKGFVVSFVFLTVMIGAVNADVLVLLDGGSEKLGKERVPPTMTVASLDGQLQAALDKHGITVLDVGATPDPAKVTLGKMLYFDKELSGNRDVACSTCHLPSEGTSDGLSLPIGVGGTGIGPERILGEGRSFVPRNAPDIFNRGAPELRSMFWDSRLTGSVETGFISPAGEALPKGLDNILAAQAMFPVTSEAEMRGDPKDVDVFGHMNELSEIESGDFEAIWDGLMKRLLAYDEYVTLFKAAYPDVPTEELTFAHSANAIAAFEIDAFTFTNSPWDRYLAGDKEALSDGTKAGALLFYGKANCSQCHSGNLLTDQEHHNIAVPQLGPGKGEEAPIDFGRGRETNQITDRFTFRTPALRNVTLTGPWMHNGAYATLEATVRHHLYPIRNLRRYAPTGHLPDALQKSVHNDELTISAIYSTLDPLVATPPELTEEEFDNLIAFLDALTDPAARDMGHVVPDAVPSGLSIDE